MPRLPKISRHFLTAVSRVHSAKNTKQRKGPGKSRLFFTLKKKAKSWKNSRNVSFQLFRDSWDINITEESWFTLCRRQILKTSGFSWGKGALFLGFRNGEWKLKKGYPFFSFECEIQINTLIFRHFSFSLSAFFAKSRIAGTDHWLFLRVYIESLTMSSQEPPNKKPKQVENKQGTLLSRVKPCSSDTEPSVV